MATFGTALALVITTVHAADYDVGPGMAYENLGDVPWESLAAGDNVLVHYRADPYAEKIVIGGAGTQDAPITVSGVVGPGGERPIIDGTDATTRSALDFWNEDRMVVKVGGANAPAETPAWVVIENLEIRGARPPATFSDASGATQPYADNAASILIETGQYVTIRNCDLHDSSNGLFASYQATDVTVDGNHIHDNGNVGDIYVHNNYTEALRITFQYNWFGPLCDGCLGNNLKDRSAGTVVRYNWIEGGNRALDLVESDYLTAEPEYPDTWVYGNVLVELDDDGNNQVAHYGGDGDDTSLYRKGTLHFHSNTVVSYRAGNTTLVRLSTAEETADARDNVIWAQAGRGYLGLVGSDGTIDLRNNWISAGWIDSHDGTGTVNDVAGNVVGDAPGFVDPMGDYHLVADSPCRDAGDALADVPAEHHPVEQYVADQSSMPRPDDGLIDIGAFEHCDTDCGGAADTTGSEGAGTSASDASDSASGSGSASGSATATASGSGSTTGDATGTDSASDSDSAGSNDGSDGGCGCTTSRRNRIALLLLFPLAMTRRRSRGRIAV